MSRVPPILFGLQPKARIWDGEIPGTFEPGFVEQPLVETPELTSAFRTLGNYAPDEEVHVLKMGECRAILGHEPGGVNGELRWHLTISHPDRHPTWDEIKVARYRLLGPDTVMAMLLPPVENYVNLPEQDHVFQLWEIEDSARVWETG